MMDAETAEAYEKFILDLPFLPPLRDDDEVRSWDAAEEMNHITNGIASMNNPLIETSWQQQQQYQHHHHHHYQQQEQPQMNGSTGGGHDFVSGEPEFYRDAPQPGPEFRTPQNGICYENVGDRRVILPQRMISPLRPTLQQQQQQYLMPNYLGYRHRPSASSGVAPINLHGIMPNVVKGLGQEPSHGGAQFFPQEPSHGPQFLPQEPSQGPQFFPQVWLQK